MKLNIRCRLGNQQGSLIAVVAIAMIAFIAVVAFVIDLGHLHSVRQELQNAAEAGALAGARALFSLPIDNPFTKTYPDCSRGLTTAQNAAAANKSDGDSVTVIAADAQLIRWEWGNAYPTKANTIYPPTPSCNLEAATGVNGIRVTTRRDSTVLAGPVSLTFGKIFETILGKDTMDVVAFATAAVGFPGGAAPGTLFPMAITQYMTQHKAPNELFQIGSSYHYPVDEAGQWTSLLIDFNDVLGIKNLMAHGNPDPISVGQTIYIQPGTAATIYDSVPVPSLVYLPVVSSLVPNSSAPVVGFIAFYITASVKKDKYIEGYFVAGQILPVLPGSPPGNIFTGTFTPPKLVE